MRFIFLLIIFVLSIDTQAHERMVSHAGHLRRDKHGFLVVSPGQSIYLRLLKFSHSQIDFMDRWMKGSEVVVYGYLHNGVLDLGFHGFVQARHHDRITEVFARRIQIVMPISEVSRNQLYPSLLIPLGQNYSVAMGLEGVLVDLREFDKFVRKAEELQAERLVLVVDPKRAPDLSLGFIGIMPKELKETCAPQNCPPMPALMSGEIRTFGYFNKEPHALVAYLPNSYTGLSLLRRMDLVSGQNIVLEGVYQYGAFTRTDQDRLHLVNSNCSQVF